MDPVDHKLKLYAETIQSPYLHYGYWDDPGAVQVESLTLDDIREAQERHIAVLSGYIPPGVKSILDVGCGLGGNSVFLQQQDFQVEALSPDPYQQTVFHDNLDSSIPFHLSKFETFETERTYDLILMCESAAYISAGVGAERAYELLRPGGYLLVSDYFVVFSDGSGSPHLKSSHRVDRFLSASKVAGFHLLEQVDITDNVLPTLDFAHHFFSRFVVPVARYASTSLERHFPTTVTLMKWLYRRKIERKLRQVDCLKSDEFRKYRKYMIFLFGKEGE